MKALISSRVCVHDFKRRFSAMQAPAYDILRYDIFRKDAATLLWIEAVGDLDAATSRIRSLAAQSGQEHIVFDQRSGGVVAKAKSPKFEQLNQNGSGS
jgi:hypothetical protein